MKLLDVLVVLAASVYLIHGGTMGVIAKLGQTLNLTFNDPEVKTVEVALKEPNSDFDRKAIVEDGNITKYGQERFGGRITYNNGVLTIKNVTKDDATSYFYSRNGYPQTIDVYIMK